VNIQRDYASALERDPAWVLRELLSRVSWLEHWNIEPVKAADGSWDLKRFGPILCGGKAVLCVECKGLNFQPIQFWSMGQPSLLSGRNASAKVLGMPRVSPRMAALCQTHGWSWFDVAGNCRLEIPGVLLIERAGNEPVKTQRRSGANPEYV
jgi:hypothetical protein